MKKARTGSNGSGTVLKRELKKRALRSKVIPMTWGRFKELVAAAGVTDDDPVFQIDIGPNCTDVCVDKDRYGQIEIGDDPTIVREDIDPPDA